MKPVNRIKKQDILFDFSLQKSQKLFLGDVDFFRLNYQDCLNKSRLLAKQVIKRDLFAI